MTANRETRRMGVKTAPIDENSEDKTCAKKK
jgi:hypothetical protein